MSTNITKAVKQARTQMQRAQEKLAKENKNKPTIEGYLDKRKSSVPEMNLKKDLVILNDTKTNKFDTEMLMKSIDIQ